jgi:hypothetical protein
VVLSSSPGYPRVGEFLDRRRGHTKLVTCSDRLGRVLGPLNSSRDLEGSKSRTEILRWRATRRKVPTGLLAWVGRRRLLPLVSFSTLRKRGVCLSGVCDWGDSGSWGGCSPLSTLTGGGEGGTHSMEHVLRVPPVERYIRNSRLPACLPDRGAVSPSCPSAGQGHESPCVSLWRRGTFLGVAVRGLAVVVALPDVLRRLFRSLTTWLR